MDYQSLNPKKETCIRLKSQEILQKIFDLSTLIRITFLVFVISAYLLYILARPIYTKDLYVDGYTKTSICPNRGVNTRLLILVASAPKNCNRRLAIRKTWGSYVKRADITLAFVLGQSRNQTKSVAKEETKYKDLIIGKFVDRYRHLTIKTLIMLRWVHVYCPNAKYILKTDDDLFLNIPNWLLLTNINVTKTIWGHIYYGSRPDRDRKSKYFVAWWEYYYKTYPIYTWGAAYMMTRDCVKPLLEASFDTPYLSMEDVFITGILADKVGISRKNIYLKGSSDYEDFFVHGVEFKRQKELWRNLTMKNRLKSEKKGQLTMKLQGSFKKTLSLNTLHTKLQ